MADIALQCAMRIMSNIDSLPLEPAMRLDLLTILLLLTPAADAETIRYELLIV